MALGDYEKTSYVNGQAPGISAQNLNKNEDKTKELDTTVATHMAEEATQDKAGHVRVGTGLKVTTGVVSNTITYNGAEYVLKADANGLYLEGV